MIMSEYPAISFGRSARPTAKAPEPDVSGQAALLLAESTLHALVAARVLTVSQALAAVRTAAEVKVEVAEEVGETADTMRRSLGLIERIERSMAAMDGAGI